jgi:hypothetical protein
MVLSWPSPNTESKPAAGENLALIAMVMVLSDVSRSADAHWL